MTSNKHVKPALVLRRSKDSRDTSQYLMNIIAELSVSKNNDERKKKMSELEKDFQAHDKRLLKMISGHRLSLFTTMDSFSEICAKINNSRRSSHQVKEKLLICKQLLECKRNEIHRLYCESVEHREVVYLLKEINNFNELRVKVEDYLKENDFVRATELLVSAVILMDGKLCEVDALKDKKMEINLIHKKLNQILIEELQKCLYNTPSNAFLRSVSDNGMDMKGYDDIFNLEKFSLKLPTEGSYTDSKENSNYKQIATILNCIASLQTLPETIEALKGSCSKELMTIVRNSAELMCNLIPSNSLYSSKKCEMFFSVQIRRCFSQDGGEKFFLDLLRAILSQFRQVAFNHYALCNTLERIAMTKGLTYGTQYDMADVYSKIQTSVELFLVDYLDSHLQGHQRISTTFAKIPTAYADISQYFLHRTGTRMKKQVLFKFDGSSHAINKKIYLEKKEIEKLKEKNQNSDDDDRSLLVCQPCAKNITVVYKTIRTFISEVEVALQLESGTHCPFFYFLMDCVKVFLDQVAIEINRMLEKIALNLDSWDAVTDFHELGMIDAKTCILKSTVSMNAFLMEMEDLILHRLSDYSRHFLEYTCNVLESYKDLCFRAYKVISTIEDHEIFSVCWTEDISETLKSQPNWAKLAEVEHTNNFEESPEEIRFRNKEENDLLFRHLKIKGIIGANEIMLDYNKLRHLALMHESMEWFSSRILKFVERLPDAQENLEKHDEAKGEAFLEVSVDVNTKTSLKELSVYFKQLADTCLLVLRLEIRIHCYYYLLPLCKQSSYVIRKEDEPDPEVLKLNSDLIRIKETLNYILQKKKMWYLFEGVGELLSSILISSVPNFKKVTENTVKKICYNVSAIQKNLTGITMTREVALERARQYFELLNLTYQEIFNKIVEEGPQFQESEYSAVILVLHKSGEGISEQDSVSVYLDKLRQILGDVSVSL